MKIRLYSPGPTQVPERALAVTSEALLHPRSEAFRELFGDVSQKLTLFFKTKHEVLTLTCSGTGAMEAAVVNFARRGDRVITVEAGKFGERWGELARIYGLRVQSLTLPWGHTAEPAQLSDFLRRHPDATAVFLTHSETSTGAAFDIKALAEIIRRESDALVIVDGISAVGVLPFYHDQWGIDVCVTGSQKGAMAPPGLAFAAVSARAWERSERSDLPKHYFDLRRAREGLAEGYGTWTSAVTLIAGLRQSLNLILDEGLEPLWARYAAMAHATREAARAIGLELFARTPGNSVTAIKIPKSVDGRRLVAQLQSRYGITVAGGQDHLKGKILRVAHMGYCDHFDMIVLASALELALRDCDWPLELGAAVKAMQIAYAEGARA
jgi:serine---pyruvate transaminase